MIPNHFAWRLVCLFRITTENFCHLLALPPHLTEVGRTRFEDIIRFNAERGEYGSGCRCTRGQLEDRRDLLLWLPQHHRLGR